MAAGGTQVIIDPARTEEEEVEDEGRQIGQYLNSLFMSVFRE